MRQRYYNPEIKRFINQDIVTGSIGNSQSLNRYCYVQGNPVSMTDPFGLFPIVNVGKDFVHAALNFLGMIPVIGTAADIANAALYVMEGDVAGAISSGLSALPGVGEIVSSGMLLVQGGKVAKAAGYVRNVCGLIGNGATFLRSGAAAITGAVGVIEHYLETGEIDGYGVAAVGLNMLAAGASGTAALSNGNSLRKMLSEDNVAGKIKNSLGNVVDKIKGKRSTDIDPPSFGEPRLKMNLQYFASDSSLSTGENSKILSANLAREGRAVGEGEAAAHIVASTGTKRQWTAAANSRELLTKYDIDINDAANGVPLGHPRPHNLTHNRAFHESVNSRLHAVENKMLKKGYGKRAIRSALRRELRSIGKELENGIGN